MDHSLLEYDGECGLCHGLIRFAALRDADDRLRFAPLQDRGGSVDLSTIRLTTPDGRVLTKGRAAVAVLKRLDRPWPLVGRILAWIPRPLLDFGYDLVGRVRRRLWPRPEGLCPTVPEDIRHKFVGSFDE